MEDEDPTLASSSPRPITEEESPTASPIIGSDNRDPDDDGDDLNDDGGGGGDVEEEKPGQEEIRDRDHCRASYRASPVTIAKPPATVGVLIPKPEPPAQATAGREDCWSEGATWALIEAWGERHLRAQAEPQSHQRGGLRQKDWEEVADVVCSRDDGGKQAKSEGQCKNRIDTLKKKYKVERLKSRSSWPYFRRLNDLLAADYEDGGVTGSGNGLSSKPPPGVGFGSFRHQLQQLQMKKKKRTTKKRSHRQLLQSVRPLPFLSPPVFRQGKEAYFSDRLRSANGKTRKKTGKEDLLLGGPISARRLVAQGAGGSEVGLRELARAVVKLGEVYERVESMKLLQAEELEKRRMGVAKELEVQRMDFFMKTLMELTHHNHKITQARLSAQNVKENHAVAATKASNHSNKSDVSGEE